MNRTKLIYLIDEFWYNYKWGLLILTIIAMLILGSTLLIMDMQKTAQDIKNLRVDTQELIKEIELANNGMNMIHNLYDNDVDMREVHYQIAFRK